MQYSNIHCGRQDTKTYCDESLVEAVEAQIPDVPLIGERRNKPQVEVGHYGKWCAGHHPKEKKRKMLLRNQ